jgi:hypothetical protein
LWAGGIVSGLILTALLVVFLLPTPLARYLVASELEKMGVESSGIETVQFDLWNSEIKVGPIRLWSQDSDPGQMMSAALIYDLGNLFNKEFEFLIEALVVDGIDIVILRDEEGAYTINGVSPAQLLGGDETSEPSEENGDNVWLAGISDLRIRNSQLLLQDYIGGTLALEIRELLLRDLFSWEPNKGGEFELDMALNDIGLEFQGELRPFADPIYLSLRGGVRDATLTKVSKFVGPLGLARQEGVLDSDLDRDMYFYSDGRVEDTTVGTIVITGVDVVSEDADQFRFEKAEINVDTSSTIHPDDSFEYAGTVRGTLDNLTMLSASGSKGSAEKIELAIEDFNAAQRGKLRAPRDQVSVGETAASLDKGVAPSLVSQVVLVVVDIVREILAHDLEFEASPSTKIEGIDIALAAKDGGPSVDLNTASLTASAPGVRASTVDAGWRIDGTLNGSIAETRSTVGQDGTVLKSSIKRIEIAAPRIGAETGEADTAVSFDVRTRFEDFVTSKSMADNSDAFDAAFAALQVNTLGFEVRSGSQGERAAGPIEVNADAIRATVRQADHTTEVEASGVVVALPSMTIENSTTEGDVTLSGHAEVLSLAASRTGEGDDPVFRIGATSWRTDIKELTMDARDDGVVLGSQFDADISTVEAQYGSDVVRVGAWESDIGKLAIDTRDDALALSGELATNLAEIETEVMVGSAPLGLALGRLRVDLASLEVDSRDDDLSLGVVGQSTWETLDASLADSDARPGGKVGLGLLTLNLQEFGFSSGATPAWRTRVDVDLADLTAQTSEKSLFALTLGGLDAKGLASDQSGLISIDEADFSALSINLSDRIITILTDDGAAADAEAQPPSKKEAAPPKLRIGRLAIAEGSTIQFTDKSVEPIARFATSIRTATIENFDTLAPSEKTTIDFLADLNEVSKLSFSGWVAPLKEPPGFDIAGQVKDLALPDFSPYIAKFTGVNVETGQLTSNFSALTNDSDLKGKLDLLLSDLDLSSATEEATQTFQADYGVPIELAIGLLEDGEGKITLTFPIGGKVDSPKIDYSDAIKTALSGVLTAFFPSFDFASDARGVRLGPIVFSAGASELDDVGRGLSQQVAKLLNEKSKLSIKVCGKATAADFIAVKSVSDGETIPDEEGQADEDPKPEDWASTVENPVAMEKLTLSDAQAESLLAIAGERTSVVRRYLIEVEGIGEDRVGRCRVTYSLKDKNPPRVEVRF